MSDGNEASTPTKKNGLCDVRSRMRTCFRAQGGGGRSGLVGVFLLSNIVTLKLFIGHGRIVGRPGVLVGVAPAHLPPLSMKDNRIIKLGN